MNRSYLHGKQFLRMKQVPQISFAVYHIYIRSTVGLNRREIHFPFLVAHIDDTVFGEEHPITSVTGGHHAVEHIDTAFNAFQDVYRSSHTHQIARFVFGKYLIH